VEVVVDPSASVTEFGVAETLKSAIVSAVVVMEVAVGICEASDELIDEEAKWDGAGTSISATMTIINPNFVRVTPEDRDFEVRTIEYDKVGWPGFLGDLALARTESRPSSVRLIRTA